MSVDLWLIEERRQVIEAALLQYCRVSSVFEKGGLVFTSKSQNLTPELQLFLQEAGITVEEHFRFVLWMFDAATTRLLSGGGEPLDRFKYGEAEYIAARVLGLPKSEVGSIDLSPGDYFLLMVRIGQTLSDPDLDTAATNLGISINAVVDALFLCTRKCLEFLRDLAIRGPLFSDQDVERIQMGLFSTQP